MSPPDLDIVKSIANRLIHESTIFVQGNDNRAAQAQIMLQSDPGPLHLSLAGPSAQLPAQFGALGPIGGTDWGSLDVRPPEG